MRRVLGGRRWLRPDPRLAAGRRRARRVPLPRGPPADAGRARRRDRPGAALGEATQPGRRAAGGQRHPGQRPHPPRHPGRHSPLQGARAPQDRAARSVSPRGEPGGREGQPASQLPPFLASPGFFLLEGPAPAESLPPSPPRRTCPFDCPFPSKAHLLPLPPPHSSPDFPLFSLLPCRSFYPLRASFNQPPPPKMCPIFYPSFYLPAISRLCVATSRLTNPFSCFGLSFALQDKAIFLFHLLSFRACTA